MNQAIQSAIARIDIMQGGKSLGRGTGFLVGDGLVLTAFHVVGNRFGNPPAPYPGEIVLTFPGHVSKAVLDEKLWNHKEDWALLRCDSPPPSCPLPLAELNSSGLDWLTFGFPDTNPQGMVQTGRIKNEHAELDGVHAFQLFSEEAAAGNGAPVKGLSGAPVMIRNAVVGLMRFALMKEQLTVAGTLYACPITLILEKTGDLLPLPDPCYGLPGIPRRPLPAEPFRYIARFTENEAEIFFGRNREIRQLYDLLTGTPSPPVTLLYGQSGVGKSSFLDAGLRPRLRSRFEVNYVRRNQRERLLATLKSSLREAGADAAAEPTHPAEGSESLASLWIEAERRLGKPVVIILDQVEEAFTLPNLESANEIEELCRHLAQAFTASPSPAGRIILSFRKEWFPELQKQVELQQLDYGKVFLENLDREAVIEIVNGLTSTRRLREFYGAQVQSGLPVMIADDLLVDRDSPVAPTLQILLTKLWKRAKAGDERNPRLSLDLYRDLVKEGTLLGDFLDQQLAELRKRLPEMVDSGLALDVLAYHTTPLLTSKERHIRELLHTYAHRPDDIVILVSECEQLFLLVDAAPDQQGQYQATRLSHDTLAPLVRVRYDQSERVGQRACRIIEGRAAEFKEDEKENLIEGSALALVELGLAGMRALKPREEKLLEASRRQHKKRALKRGLLLTTYAILLGAIILSSAYAWRESLHASEREELSQLRHTTDLVQYWLSVEPVNGLVLAIAALGDSREASGSGGRVLGELQQSLNRAMELAPEKFLFHVNSPVNSVVCSSSGIIAAGTSDGRIFLWNLSGEILRDPWQADEKSVAALAFSPDGKLLASGGTGKTISLWDRSGHPVGSGFAGHTDVVQALAFTPNGNRIVSGSRDGTIRVWSLDGKPASRPFAGHQGGVNALAVTVTPQDEVVIVSGGDDGTIRLWDPIGRQLAEPFRGHEGAVKAVTVAYSKWPEPLAQVRAGLPERRMLFASGGEDRKVRLWDQKGHEQGFPLGGHRGSIWSIALTPGGDWVITGDEDGSLRFFDLRGFETIPSVVGPDAQISGIAIDAEGRHLIAGSQDGTVRVFDLHARTQIGHALVAHSKSPVNAVAFKPNSALLVTAGNDGRIVVWDTRTGSLVKSPPAQQGALTALAFDASGSTLATGGADGSIRFWDGAALTPGKRMSAHKSAVLSLTFSPDGQFLVSCEQSGVAAISDSKDGKLLRTIPLSQSNPCATAFHPDGKYFATAGGSGQIQFWDRQGNAFGKAIETNESLWTLYFSEDGQRLFAGSDSGYVRHWILASQKEEKKIKTNNGAVRALVVRKDPDNVANIYAGGKDAYVAAYSHLSGDQVSVDLSSHQDVVTSLSLNSDGDVMATASLDGTVRLWRGNWRSWLLTSCNRLRQHPVFLNPEKWDQHWEISPGRGATRAKEVCTQLAWNKE
jgi:WD40 repeat protein